MKPAQFYSEQEINKLLAQAPPGIRAYCEELKLQIQKLAQIGYDLSATHDLPQLLDAIIREGMRITNADGGTLYLRTEDDRLKFEIMKTRSMGIDYGGVSGKPVPEFIYPVRMYLEDGSPNYHNVSAYVALTGKTANIPDAYESKEFDFSGTRGFDKKYNYRSKSFLTIAMKNHEGDIIGVLQLLNAQHPVTGEVIPFTKHQQRLVESLASQAAVAITNHRLIQDLENLLESFIKLIADAIDEKSPYTGGHCKRVPVIAMELAEEVSKIQEGPFANVKFSPDDMHELRIASWLHDIGKITTPEYVVDKATKLETIYDRINEVAVRFEVLKRDVEIEYLKRKQAIPPDDKVGLEELEAWRTQELAALEEELAFLRKCNVGGEFMAPEKQERVHQIAQRKLVLDGQEVPVLTDEWVENLNIPKGTLTDKERQIINNHIVVTINMLEKLPFPKKLRRVPEFAGGHHEKMDGTGYPRGLTREQMSIQARIMGIADVFEALTATDRPYKKGKKLSEAIRIMGFFKQDNHIDPDLFDVFLKSGVYKKYAEKYMRPEYIDEVDIEPYLKIKPKPVEPRTGSQGN